MKNNSSVPLWLITALIAIVLAIGTVSTIAVTNAATIKERKAAQITQFDDIKARLVRIEAKLDALEK